ncbi:YciI family protein [Mycobacterium sp.]|uniref:YciI family protein n=1 Tax=Mycobacterium sp. TaxID=1785 RepID=UPI002BF99FBD|nr:YciI family protein [Mycobacterium sp.]HME49641.1 YciI family protein [Mycobacterium sp.]
MHYFALLLSPSGAPEERTDPAALEAEMAAYNAFHAKEASSIRAGDALTSASDGVRITGGPQAPVVTDGPFPESAEVAGGYYVFEADDLDAALALARQIPHAAKGAVEIWPMVHEFASARKLTGNDWIALLFEPPADTVAPGSLEWEAGIARHGEFAAAAGDHILGGAALHPPSTATTMRVRDGGTLLTDGPFVEGAEVANGFYVLAAADRDEAVKIASMIPATTVEVRRLLGVAGL